MRLREFEIGGDNSDDDLFKYAKMYYHGNDIVKQQVSATLKKIGWDIGLDQGQEPNGVYVVPSGEENSRGYESWSAEELEQD